MKNLTLWFSTTSIVICFSSLVYFKKMEKLDIKKSQQDTTINHDIKSKDVKN